MRRLSVLFILMTMTLVGAFAQWTDDVSKNTQITPNNLTLYDGEMSTTADGRTYYFFQVPQGSQQKRSMRLQIVDSEGKRKFASGGTTVSEERNVTFTKVNQSTMKDRDDNLIIAVYDQRNTTDGTTFGYYVYKYSPDGEKLWGPVALNGGNETRGAVALSMCCTADNHYVFAYGDGDLDTDFHVACERMASDGSLVWDAPLTFHNDGGRYTYPYVANSGDNTMLLYTDNGSTVYARAIDAQGADVWESPVEAYNGGFATSKIWDVLSVSEGLHGSVLISAMDSNYNSRLACIGADGSQLMPEGAAGVMLNQSQYGAEKPALACDAANDMYYAAFPQFATDFSEYGLFVQKFSADGTQQWDEPRAAMPFESDCQLRNVSIVPSVEGRWAIFCQRMEGTGSTGDVANYMLSVDSEGTPQGQPYNFATSATTKDGLQVSALVADAYFVAGWMEKRAYSDTQCFYMQKVTATPDTSPVDAVTSAPSPSLGSQFFAPDGSRRATMAKGVNIVRTRFADGSELTTKVVR